MYELILTTIAQANNLYDQLYGMKRHTLQAKSRSMSCLLLAPTVTLENSLRSWLNLEREGRLFHHVEYTSMRQDALYTIVEGFLVTLALACPRTGPIRRGMPRHGMHSTLYAGTQ